MSHWQCGVFWMLLLVASHKFKIKKYRTRHFIMHDVVVCLECRSCVVLQCKG